jgi:hypothetical protein
LQLWATLQRWWRICGKSTLCAPLPLAWCNI